MAGFLKRLAVFSAFAFVGLNAVGLILVKGSWQGHAVENSRIYQSIDKTRENWSQSQVFVFGDSVANQMYPPESNSDRINSVALVMPSTMAGQYFLLQRLFQSNDLEGKEVTLILSPSFFSRDLDHKSSYHYVLKPFHNREFQPWNDPVFASRISNQTLASLSQLPVIKCSNWTPPPWMPYLNEENLNTSEEPEGISEFSAHYLRKMIALAGSEKAKIRVLPTIQRKSQESQSYLPLKDDIEHFQLSTTFSEYFENFRYFDDHHFIDSAHLGDRSLLGKNILNL